MDRVNPAATRQRTNPLRYNDFPCYAEVAELADAQDLGSCGREAVEVQILSSAELP